MTMNHGDFPKVWRRSKNDKIKSILNQGKLSCLQLHKKTYQILDIHLHLELTRSQTEICKSLLKSSTL
ncbi:mCG1040251 [Mus musculus]|nr:mCG1040251 [Mus musculus]